MPELKNKIDPLNWVDTYSDELYGYAMSKTSKPEVAEDLVQETFLAALNSLSNFKGDSSERTWLYSILKHKISDYYRKASTKREIPNAKLSNEEGRESFIDNRFDQHDSWTGAGSPKDWGITYDNSYENKELGAVLDACLENLPSNQKQIITAKLIEGEKTENICKDFNITSTNYWVIMHRAKLQLRDCLESNWLKD